MLLEWVKTVGPILISWPIVGLIAILLFRKPLLEWANKIRSDDVQRVKVGGWFELENKVEKVEKKVDQVTARQDHQAFMINQLVMFSMAWYQFKMLEEIYAAKKEKRYYKYNKDHNTNRNLFHLRDYGYISIDGIANLSGGENLAELVEITPAGEFLIELRKTAESSKKVKENGD